MEIPPGPEQICATIVRKFVFFFGGEKKKADKKAKEAEAKSKGKTTRKKKAVVEAALQVTTLNHACSQMLKRLSVNHPSTFFLNQRNSQPGR